MRKFLCILATIAAASLSACGQPGPLYLPERPQLPAKPAAKANTGAQTSDPSDSSRQP